MATVSTSEFKGGLKLMMDGDPYNILENEFVKPGKGQAFNRVKLRNLKTGRVIERTFKSGETMETADVVLMKSDPFDVIGALGLSRATLRKMQQNLWWAAGYNIIAFPIAAGVFYPAFGLVLRPEIAALSMSGSSLLVAINALLLKRFRLHPA